MNVLHVLNIWMNEYWTMFNEHINTYRKNWTCSTRIQQHSHVVLVLWIYLRIKPLHKHEVVKQSKDTINIWRQNEFTKWRFKMSQAWWIRAFLYFANWGEVTSAVVGFPVGVAEVKFFWLQYIYFEVKHDVDCRKRFPVSMFAWTMILNMSNHCILCS